MVSDSTDPLILTFAIFLQASSSSFCNPEVLFICLFVFAFCHIVGITQHVTPAAYGCSQSKGQIGAIAAGLCYNHSHVTSGATSVLYTTAQGNARSLTP